MLYRATFRKISFTIWRDEFNIQIHYSRQTFEKIIKTRFSILRDGQIIDCYWILEKSELKEEDLESLK
jgi:hypothetical protein